MTEGRISLDRIVEVQDLTEATTQSRTTEIRVGQPVVRYASGQTKEELVRNIQAALVDAIKVMPPQAVPDWPRALIYFQRVAKRPRGFDGVGLPITVD